MAERVEFLLEIGCEEIPASWLPGLTAQAGELLAKLAGESALEPAGVESHSTPRRLVLRAELLGRQADREEQAFGPAVKLAKDARGQWTKAAEGFAKKCGVALDELRRPPRTRRSPTSSTCCSRSAPPARRPPRSITPKLHHTSRTIG